jgi:hypothetical protein
MGSKVSSLSRIYLYSRFFAYEEVTVILTFSSFAIAKTKISKI